MVARISVIIWLLSLVPATAWAEFFINQATHELADAGQPALAASSDGWTMLAYHADEKLVLMSFIHTQLVPTRATDTPDDWPAPQLINSGTAPEVCWSREGYTLAFASGEAVLVYQADPAGNWDLDNYEIFFPGGPVLGLDLWGVPVDGAGPHVFLTIDTSLDPPDGDHRVHLAARTLAGWSELLLVTEDPVQHPRSQVTWSQGGYGPRPTVCYLGADGGDLGLFLRTYDETGWSQPESVPVAPLPIGGEFDIITHGVGARNILGLGPQPTCPCGTIHHLSASALGDWTVAENLTVSHGAMDWPMSPRLGVDPEGRVHALWYQQMSGSDLEPHRRDLEYWIRESEVWTDAGAFLDGQSGGPLGERVALSVSPDGDAVLAWTRRDTLGGAPQPRQVWIARPLSTAAAPEGRVPPVAISLTAWPNPFNPRVTLVVDVSAPQTATLAIFDARGRCLRRLLEAMPLAGRRELFWDGKDAAGREVPSGVYFARVLTPSDQVTSKLVLAR